MSLRELARESPPLRLSVEFRVAQERERRERVGKLVGVAHVGPHLVAYALDRVGVELPEVGGGFGIEPAPCHDRLRTPLLERRIVEESVRPRGQDLGGERRRLGQLAGEHPDLAALEAREHSLEAVDVHRLVQAIGDRLR